MTDANGWNAWLSISARKLRFDDRREREGKKTIEKDACQIANMHMQHHARSLIVVRSDALSFNRASSSSICTRKVLFYELYRANFDTSKWYAPRARIHEAKPFKPSGCNAPITCAHREKERERERREERGGGRRGMERWKVFKTRGEEGMKKGRGTSDKELFFSFLFFLGKKD